MRLKTGRLPNALLRSIEGKGAFRRFKDALHRHGIEMNWYAYKDEAYKEIARDWCEENCVCWRE
jgi:hypothetical protein